MRILSVEESYGELKDDLTSTTCFEVLVVALYDQLWKLIILAVNELTNSMKSTINSLKCASHWAKLQYFSNYSEA